MGEMIGLLCLVLIISIFYRWTVRPGPFPEAFVKESRGYYNLLTRGFMKSQLNLDVEADPMLATLQNPWDPAQRAGRGMHDATYYRGKYYLYFGITPVVVLFLPFRLLTGLFISESMASLVFALGGFMMTVALLRMVRVRYFPNAPIWLLLAGVMALGLSTMVPALLRRPSVWEVPIACGYACTMLAFGCLYQALHSPRRARWIAGASFTLGLAVGGRPVYVLGCIALLIPVLYWARRDAGGRRGAWRAGLWCRTLLAAVVPAASVGMALATYNYLRFGNPLEFGQTYQMAGDDVTKLQFFSWRYPLYGFQLYVLEPAAWSPYFPFVKVITPPPAPVGQLGIENPYGMLPNMPFVLLGFGILALSRRVCRGDFLPLLIFSGSVFLHTFLTMG